MKTYTQDDLQDPGFTSTYCVFSSNNELVRLITAIAADFIDEFDIDSIIEECWEICEECSILAEDGSPVPGEFYIIEDAEIEAAMQRNDLKA